MQYKVVPFVATISMTEGSAQAADQLEKLIASWVDSGWTYVRLETVETYIAGSDGCFGVGAQPPRVVAYTMAVFQHD